MTNHLLERGPIALAFLGVVALIVLTATALHEDMIAQRCTAHGEVAARIVHSSFRPSPFDRAVCRLPDGSEVER